MTRSLPPFWLSVFHRCGVIFFGTLTFFFTLGVVGFSATLFFALLGILVAPASETSPYEHVSGKESSRDRILRIDITGLILGSPQNEEDSFFAPLVGVTYGYSVFYYDRPTSLDHGLLMGGVTANSIEERTLSAGRGKDIGHPFRRLTPQEIEVLQAGLEQEYSKFINHLAQARGIDPNVIRNEMGAMIFSNDQAQSYGLIDGTRSRQETLSALASAAHLKEGEYAIVRFRRDRSPLINQVFGVQSPLPALEAQHTGKQEQLCALSRLRALAYYGSLSCRPW